MHIVHVITRLVRGGADENTIETCNGQVGTGHRVTLIVGRELHAAMRAKLAPEVEFISLPSLVRDIAPIGDILALGQLYRELVRLNPDLLHTHTSKAGVLARIAGRTAGVKKIVHGVHIIPFFNQSGIQNYIYESLERICGTHTHLFVHVSSGTEEMYRHKRIGRKARHVIAASGMDVDRFRGSMPPNDTDDLLKSPVEGGGRPFAILAMCALEPRKRIDKFLPIFRRLLEFRSNTVLLIAGDGPQRDALRASIKAGGLEQHVRLLGYRDDSERLLAIADALVVVSEREGLPRSVVQAAIAGVPVVSMELPGIERVVRNGETGFVVPMNNFDALIAPLVELANEPNCARRFRERLNATDFSPWRSEAMVATIETAYAAIGAVR
jgi:glycosyltransferase involved in cell wall biosynthesis